MGFGVGRDALAAHAVVEGHVVVVVAEVDGAVGRDAHGDGVVLILRLLDVVREPEDLPLRGLAAAVEVPPPEGDLVRVVRARRLVVSDVLPGPLSANRLYRSADAVGGAFGEGRPTIR